MRVCPAGKLNLSRRNLGQQRTSPVAGGDAGRTGCPESLRSKGGGYEVSGTPEPGKGIGEAFRRLGLRAAV